MKSICIKTNDKNKINYLLNECDDISLKDVFLSSYKFKIFQNVIIHYKGKNEKLFLEIVSEKIAGLKVEYYQDKYILKDIKENYFYLDSDEKEIIIRITKKIVNSPEYKLDCKKDILASLVYNYFLDNKSMILDGFVQFRLKEYKKVLDYIIELSVYNYLNLTVY